MPAVDPVTVEPAMESIQTLADAPGLELVSAELQLVMRAPREPADGVFRVTGYRSMDPQTGMAPAGETAQLNRVVELAADEDDAQVTLQLASHLYYQATFGAGEIPQPGDWMGPMTQWLGTGRFFLMVNQMKLE